MEQITAMGFEEKIMKRPTRLVDMREDKRRQAPRVIKLIPKVFGRDWRLPVTNLFNGW